MITEKLVLSLAYKYIALAVMLGEINFTSSRLALPIEMPVTEKQVKGESHIAPPRLMEFGGRVATDSFVFAFNNGRLNYIIKRREQQKGESIAERFEALSKQRSLIGTNEAYRLATNWLSAVDVDVAALEKKHHPRINQRFYYPDAVASGSESPEQLKRRTLLPIFDVEWGEMPRPPQSAGVSIPAVVVAVFGPTKELLELSQHDMSFSWRLANPIKDVEALLAVKDEDFIKYTLEQRGNLLHRFSVRLPK